MSTRVQSAHPDVMQQLGELTEAARRGDEDRRGLQRAVETLATGIHNMELAFNGMTQTMNSTSSAIANIAAQGLGEKVHEIERRVDRYDRIFGSVGKFAWKAVSALVSSAVGGGIIVKLLTHWHYL